MAPNDHGTYATSHSSAGFNDPETAQNHYSRNSEVSPKGTVNHG